MSSRFRVRGAVSISGTWHHLHQHGVEATIHQDFRSVQVAGAVPRPR
jgi:hypothetical protein